MSKNMKNKNKKTHPASMDTVLAELQHKGKNNQNSMNSKNIDKSLTKNLYCGDNIETEIPFSLRFKDKFFAFNKMGMIYKLDQNSLCRPSQMMNKKIKNPSLLFKSKKHQKDLNKIDNQSRKGISLQTKMPKRVTRSLDASKISRVSSKQKSHIYGSDCYSIKQQQTQKIVIKIPIKPGRIYTPIQYSRCDRNDKNTISATQFQGLKYSQQAIEQNNLTPYFYKKQHFFQQFNSKTKQKTNKTIKLQQPNLMTHGKTSKGCLPQIPCPRKQYLPKKRFYTSNDQRKSESQNYNLHPKIKYNYFKNNSILNQQQNLVTIR